MIYYMKAQLLLLISGLTLLTSCFNDEVFPTLPPETQEGLNTFGCLVDGVLLTPSDGEDGFGGQGASGINVDYAEDSLVNSLRPPYLAIFARNYSSNIGPEYIYIYIPSLTSKGSFTIDASNGLKNIDSPPHAHLYAGVWRSDNTFIKYLSINQGGGINITRFNPDQSLVAGTFSATLVDEETRLDTIRVTEGRFDIDWSKLE
ncbi:MAG: hypothetical protein ACJA2C_000892 [Marinoscillum sp.]|jgi:hypothetical protein